MSPLMTSILKVRKMQTLLAFDENDDIDWCGYDDISDELEYLYNRMIEGNYGILIEGCLGFWDGPHDIIPFTAVTFEDFMRMFDKDITAFEMCLVDNDEDISELQRYSRQWKITAKKGSVVVKAWHQDRKSVV